MQPGKDPNAFPRWGWLHLSTGESSTPIEDVLKDNNAERVPIRWGEDGGNGGTGKGKRLGGHATSKLGSRKGLIKLSQLESDVLDRSSRDRRTGRGRSEEKPVQAGAFSLTHP